MKEVRLEVNLDVNPNVNMEELLERIRWALNVYGVTRVQSVTVVKEGKPW